MKVKSLAELLKIQKSLKATIDLREKGESDEKRIDILVGMATCGIASGAKETYDKLNELIAKRHLKNINVIKVGCVGYCSKEPTLEVCKTGKVPVLYGDITVEKAEIFLDTIINNTNDLDKNIVEMQFSKVVN